MTLALVPACVARLAAQNHPLSAELKRFYEGSKKQYHARRGKACGSGLELKPTATARNFGEEVAHAAESQVIICGARKGEQRPYPGWPVVRAASVLP